uniref:Retroviral polymerase SH3-like domain-containing protein n=1 Tax=Peronospora matthiolae TaxID=2874970 RepID=A0AAV1UPU6_9STRA
MRVFGAKGYAHFAKPKRLKLDKKAFQCMFLGYSHEVKGYCVWNFDSNRLELTRSVTLQELPKSKYVQVIANVPATTRASFDDDDDAGVVQLPSTSTHSEVELMIVDHTGTY